VSWPTKTLIDFAAINPRLDRREKPNPDDEVSFVPMAAVSEESASIVDPQIRTYREVAKGYTYFEEHDLLFAKITPCMENGKVALATNLRNGIGFGSTEFHVIRANSETLPRLIWYFVRTQPFRDGAKARMRGAGGQQRVPQDYLEEAAFPEIPLREQDRIVEILDQGDALRQQRRQADALSQKILPALFHEMFGDVRSNPHSWPMDTLQNLARVVTGSTPSSKLEGMFDGPVPFVTPADLKETWVDHNRSVTKEGAAQCRTVRAGSALVCCIGATIGKMGKATEESAFNQQINAVEWFDDSFDSYGLEALKQIRNQIISGASSTTLPIMNKSTFQALQIPLPPKDLRMKFAEQVAGLEATARNQSISAATLETLFQTLLHRAFDGSLTAKWREGHAKELLQEMEHQAR
jgi:type I restriction enzyme S subunit